MNSPSGSSHIIIGTGWDLPALLPYGCRDCPKAKIFFKMILALSYPNIKTNQVLQTKLKPSIDHKSINRSIDISEHRIG